MKTAATVRTKEGDWYADDFNCRKYWHCYIGNISHMMFDTKDELLYNPNLIQCNFPE